MFRKIGEYFKKRKDKRIYANTWHKRKCQKEYTRLYANIYAELGDTIMARQLGYEFELYVKEWSLWISKDDILSSLNANYNSIKHTKLYEAVVELPKEMWEYKYKFKFISSDPWQFGKISNFRLDVKNFGVSVSKYIENLYPWCIDNNKKFGIKYAIIRISDGEVIRQGIKKV